MVRSCKNIHETKGARVPAFVRIGKTRTSARIASACCCCSAGGPFEPKLPTKYGSLALRSHSHMHGLPSGKREERRPAWTDEQGLLIAQVHAGIHQSVRAGARCMPVAVAVLALVAN